jgi:membrane protease YdiL (CAAX protease family)
MQLRMNWDHLSEIVAWEPSDLAPALAIGAVTIGFIIYYFVMSSKKLEGQFYKRYGEEEGQARWIIFTRIFGGFMLGFPAVLLPMLWLGKLPSDYGMGLGMSTEALIICAILCPLLIIINIFRAGKPKNLIQYPQIRKREWDLATFMGSSVGWVIYLLGYELCFRGFLLFGCYESLGFLPAVAINASIYAFAHFFKGIGETVGAIPFGILISIISLFTGNFMVAFLVHCSLALSNQTVAFLAHPNMKWKRG